MTWREIWDEARNRAETKTDPAESQNGKWTAMFPHLLEMGFEVPKEEGDHWDEFRALWNEYKLKHSWSARAKQKWESRNGV